MKLKSRILPLAAVVAATVAAGPVLARDWDGGQVDVPPPEAVNEAATGRNARVDYFELDP